LSSPLSFFFFYFFSFRFPFAQIKKRALVKAVWCGTTQGKIAVKVSLESMAPYGFDVA